MAIKSLTHILNSWYTKFKRYSVSYKKGFFHLSNLANSPQTIIESFDKMPFCKHVRSEKLLTANTPFLKAQLYYYELEEGLWIFVSDLNYRKNLLMTNIYDKSLPMDYHFLNLHYREKSLQSKSMMVNGLLLTNKTWSVFKSGNALTDYHFKDSNEKNITVYFTSKWLANKLKSKNAWNKFGQFMESENKYVLLADVARNSDLYYEQFFDWTSKEDSKQKQEKLNSLVNNFFECFFDLVNNEIFSEDHFKLSDKDRKYVQRAEKILLDCLLTEFPGIENIAEKIGVSPTKLKIDFKTIHNKSMYQFYSYHQMRLAYRLISKKIHPIKDVAKVLGYENASKFSARFKEEFGVSPSDI